MALDLSPLDLNNSLPIPARGSLWAPRHPSQLQLRYRVLLIANNSEGLSNFPTMVVYSQIGFPRDYQAAPLASWHMAMQPVYEDFVRHG